MAGTRAERPWAESLQTSVPRLPRWVISALPPCLVQHRHPVSNLSNTNNLYLLGTTNSQARYRDYLSSPCQQNVHHYPCITQEGGKAQKKLSHVPRVTQLEERGIGIKLRPSSSRTKLLTMTLAFLELSLTCQTDNVLNAQSVISHLIPSWPYELEVTAVLQMRKLILEREWQ